MTNESGLMRIEQLDDCLRQGYVSITHSDDDGMYTASVMLDGERHEVIRQSLREAFEALNLLCNLSGLAMVKIEKG